MVRDRFNNLQQCRALLDSGAQATLIAESCLQHLGLKRRYDKTLMTGVGICSENYTRGKVDLEIVSHQYQRILRTQAYCLSKLTRNIPSHDIQSDKFDFFRDVALSDPRFNKSGTIDIIMGADLYCECVLPEKIAHPSGLPVAINTLFGWVVMGRVQEEQQAGIFAAHVSLDLGDQLRRFWEIENVSQSANMQTTEECKAELHFQETFQRLANGRYMVKLPFRNNTADMGESKSTALKRFKALERKFESDDNLKADYTNFMQEYLDLNHMEPDNSSTTNNGYILPHHAILKPGSTTTKLRVVFDASCKTSNGNSLNDELLVGPTIQNDLLTIILNFRKFEIGMSADVEKMYRQIIIHPDDIRFQRILWRQDNNEPIREYHLNTVTYGISSASYLATRTLHQISLDNASEHVEAAHAIDEHFYVDDFMYCSKDVQSAETLRISLCSVLSQAGFHLRKWSSNSREFMRNIDENDRESSTGLIIESSQKVKTLGLWWDTQSDEFRYTTVLHPLPTVVTKRLVLSDIAKIFDPVGWLAPVVVALKVFMQKLWLQGIDWDQQLPDNLLRHWNILRDGITAVSQIRIPRWLKLQDSVRIELHGFADSSELAYAAAIYLKVIHSNGKIYTNLVIAKTRVAPVKQLSIPRLELCAAHLLTSLIVSVSGAMKLEQCEVVAWSDSTVVLSWLADHPRRWKSFVANRTSYILEHIPTQHWRHIKSENNPADLATRGLSASNLLGNELW